MWLKLPLSVSVDPALAEIGEQRNMRAEGLIATLGNFDGVHLGHQALLAEVKKEALLQNRSSALISFSPHPAKVFTACAPRRLTSFRQLTGCVRSQGVDNLIIIRFTPHLAEMEAEQFVDQFLIERYNVQHLVIGPFATIGKNRKGTPEWIADYFQSRGRRAEVLAAFCLEDKRVSSNQIRSLISEGNIALAGRLLGRPYRIMGRVIKGDKIGRTLGFPTANIDIRDYAKPPYGVYFAQVCLKGVCYTALSNFGVRPTFGGRQEVLETHLLDYGGADFYGQRIELELIEKVRDEKQFSSTAELCRQISADIEKVRNLIEKRS